MGPKSTEDCMLDLESQINRCKEIIEKIFDGIISKDNGQLPWCEVQNEAYDSLLDVFQINTYDGLKKGLIKVINDNNLKGTEKAKEIAKYLTRRCLVVKFSQIDELLFQKYGASPNPISKAKGWDFISHNIKFDLKSSRVFKDDFILKQKIIKNEVTYEDFQTLGENMYKRQSGFKNKKGRYSINNRLFLIHVSNNDTKNVSGEDRLRLMFNIKELAIKYFMDLDELHLHKTTIDNIEAIFTFLVIYEDEEGNVRFYNA